jgi:ceramide glucosyltransferase
METIYWLCLALALATCGYVLLAADCVRRFGARLHRESRSSSAAPSVTVFKPLCGSDVELLENLRAFCRQDYHEYQIVFGVRDPADPAIAVARQIISEFPALDLDLVIDPTVHGTNLKISNLINMYHRAKHNVLVIADSDMRVGPDYLRRLCNALNKEGAGMVTCLYLGDPLSGLPSALGALFINEWFLPSVLVATRFVPNSYCFGATMAIPRSVLEEVGGLGAFADYLADDYMLGRKVLATGRRVDIAPVLVENRLLEPAWRDLIAHELRWARTIRTVQPAGFAASFLTDALPLACLCLLFAWLNDSGMGFAIAAAGFALIARSLLHLSVNKTFNRRAAMWLIPLRDLLTFLIRAGSFLGGDVEWRRQSLHVDNGSRLSMKD